VTPSLLTRALIRIAPIEPRETAAVVAAFCLFFFMWGGYFAVRPVRETIGTILGREQTANLWIFTSLVSVLIIPVYGAVVARFKRAVFLPWTYAVVAAVLTVTATAFQDTSVDPLIGKCFYVFISVVNLLLISMFWSFLLEIFDSGQAKRLFGVVAAGGSAGALVGPMIADFSVGSIGNSGVLFVGASLFVIAIFCQRTLLRIWSEQPAAAADPARVDRPIGGNLFAGVTLILKSPYLLGIALFVVMISTVSTFLYFEQLQLVEQAFPVLADRTRIFARLDWIVQSLTVVSQILLTGRIAARFGVTALLTLLPVLMVAGFIGLSLSPTFAVLAAVFVMRRACEYAFVRPGREMLWSPLGTEAKYKAKNTIDVPVYRGADAIAAQVSNGLSTAGFTTAAVALLGAVASVMWGAIGWWLGRRFETIVAKQKSAA
jgi:AAA family ATP:ADP antiporter